MELVNEILGYDVVATLGHGARSTIYAVKDKDDQVYALKRVVKESAHDQRFIDQAICEHEVASQLHHPTLRRSLKLIKQRALIRTSEVFVLMELVDGQSLEQRRPDDLTELCQLCQQVADGLGHMHGKGLVHADIKPNNIMVTEGQRVKIIDFGQSCPTGTVKQRIQGTPDYIAPEQVLRREITPRTDIFNFGASMYWLFTGHHVPTLIPKGEPGMLVRQDDSRKPPHQLNDQVTPALSQLVMHCLEAEPHRRPTNMREIHDRLDLAITQISRRRNSDSTVLGMVEDQDTGGDGDFI